MIHNNSFSGDCTTCLGKLLERSRKAKGISQEILGDLIGYSRTRIWDFEHGELPITVEVVNDIATALRLSEVRYEQMRTAYRCAVLARSNVFQSCGACPCSQATGHSLNTKAA